MLYLQNLCRRVTRIILTFPPLTDPFVNVCVRVEVLAC